MFNQIVKSVRFLKEKRRILNEKSFNRVAGVNNACFGISGVFLAAEGDVEINETNFPDESVRYVVKKADKDKNNVLSQEEIAAVTELKFSSYPAPLADMTGLEHFTNVETLSISSSSMTEMDCSIFPKLTTLKCGSNSSVKKLDVSKNTELVTLDCSGDKI